MTTSFAQDAMLARMPDVSRPLSIELAGQATPASRCLRTAVRRRGCIDSPRRARLAENGLCNKRY